MQFKLKPYCILTDALFLCVSLQPRQTVLTAAGSIGQASGDLLRQIGENETDERFQVTLQPAHGGVNEMCCSDVFVFKFFFLITAILVVHLMVLFHGAHTWLNCDLLF